MEFVTLPILTWLVCGAVKFGTNVVRYRDNAWRRIGHGGFPSNHTAIVSSLLWAFVLTGEWQLAGLTLALLMITVFDATGLRREVGQHATTLNQLTGARLREVMGHNVLDIAGGVVVGLTMAVVYWTLGGIA